MGSGAKGGLENPLWTVLVTFFAVFWYLPTPETRLIIYIHTVFATFACKRCFLQHVDNRVNTKPMFLLGAVHKTM